MLKKKITDMKNEEPVVVEEVIHPPFDINRPGAANNVNGPDAPHDPVPEVLPQPNGNGMLVDSQMGSNQSGPNEIGNAHDQHPRVFNVGRLSEFIRTPELVAMIKHVCGAGTDVTNIPILQTNPIVAADRVYACVEEAMELLTDSRDPEEQKHRLVESVESWTRVLVAISTQLYAQLLAL